LPGNGTQVSIFRRQCLVLGLGDSGSLGDSLGESSEYLIIFFEI